jgi:hypothetical protein
MTRFADPTRCPDCGQAITYDDLACPSCLLPLRGDTAARLFQTLTVADQLLGVLRAGAASLPLGSASEPQHAAGPVVAPAGSAPSGDTGDIGRTRGGLSAASVPKILLSLGAACVLIAAFVFLAVTWSQMGVGGRTATLVALTVAAGVLAAWMARRVLRGAAEALSVVTLGLLTLDVYGARDAGWLGDLSTPTFLVLLGTVLLVVATAAGVAAARAPVRRLTGPEVVAGIGAALTAYGIATHEALVQSVANILAVLVALAVVAAAYRLRLL